MNSQERYENCDRGLEAMKPMVETNMQGTEQLPQSQKAMWRPNHQIVAELRQSLAELRKENALLLQMLSQEREMFHQFQRIANGESDPGECNVIHSYRNPRDVRKE